MKRGIAFSWREFTASKKLQWFKSYGMEFAGLLTGRCFENLLFGAAYHEIKIVAFDQGACCQCIAGAFFESADVER